MRGQTLNDIYLVKKIGAVWKMRVSINVIYRLYGYTYQFNMASCSNPNFSENFCIGIKNNLYFEK